MIALIKQTIMSLKAFLGGATSGVVGDAVGLLPEGFGGVTDILGFGIPTFLIYLVFLND